MAREARAADTNCSPKKSKRKDPHQVTLRHLAAGDGGNEEDAVAFLEAARLAAEEADVFLVEINVEELADLALFIANVAREGGELRGQIVEGFGDGRGTTVVFG